MIENEAPFTVWVAIIGPGNWNERPHLTGFELEPGSWRVVPLPEGLASIRIWGRTGLPAYCIRRGGLRECVVSLARDQYGCGHLRQTGQLVEHSV